MSCRKSPLPRTGPEFSLSIIVLSLMRLRLDGRLQGLSTREPLLPRRPIDVLGPFVIVLPRLFSLFQQIGFWLRNLAAFGRLLHFGIEKVNHLRKLYEMVHAVCVTIEKYSHLVNAGQLPRQRLALAPRKRLMVLNRGRS